jgi:hypothetical protein
MTFNRKTFIWLRAAAPLIVAVAAAVFSAMPAAAKDVCKDWGSPSFYCPTSATRGVCGVAPNLWCLEDNGNPDADLCVGATPSPRYRFSCATCKCECDTSNFPCPGCTVGTSTVGAACGSVSGGRVVDYCGTCGCPSGTALCAATNSCVTAQTCAAGTVFDGCTRLCVAGTSSTTQASTTQSNQLPVSGSQFSAPSGDLYLTDGSSIRVDGIGSTRLNIGNLQGGPFALLVNGSVSVSSLKLGGSERTTWPSLKAVTVFKRLTPGMGKGWKAVDCPSGYLASGWSGYNCEEAGGAWVCGKAAIYDSFIRVWYGASARAYIWLRCLNTN